MTQECPIDGMDCGCPNGHCAADPTGEIQRACKGGVDLTKPRRTMPPTLEEKTEAWQHIAKRDAKILEALALSEAADRLRAAGWTVLPPPGEAVPEPAVGQVWRAPSSRVEPRTVVEVGPRPLREGVWVSHRVPSTPWDCSCSLKTWRTWARKSGARPEGQP